MWKIIQAGKNKKNHFCVLQYDVQQQAWNPLTSTMPNEWLTTRYLWPKQNKIIF